MSNPLHAVGAGSGSDGGGTEYTEDAAAAANPVGTVPMLVRKDTPASEVSLDGDNIAQRGTAYGSAYATLLTSAGALTGVDATPLVVNFPTGSAGNVNVGGFNGGSVASFNAGNVGATTPRVTIATDDANMAAIKTSVQLIDNLVLAEDAAHQSGDPGMMLLAVRQDAQVDFAADGDYVPLSINEAGELRVVSSGVSGGTSSVDDAAFTVAVGSGTPMMGVVTADSVDTNDVGVVGMLANRQLKVTLYDSGGVEQAVGGGTQYTEDAVAAANPIGTALNLIREDARAGGLTTLDGDNVAARGTNAGELYVKHVDTIAVTQSGTWDEVGINDSGNSITVDGTITANLSATDNTVLDNIDTSTAGILADTANIETAVQLIDDIIYVDDTATHATGSSKGALIMAAATPTDAAVNANDIGAVAMTTDRKLHVAVMDALPAGTNGIGKLTSNSGVDIGDVDILSIAAGDNNIGNVDIASIAAGDNNIGNVDIVSLPASTNTLEVVGDVAHDVAIAGNPVVTGGVSSAAAPADVSADQEAVRSWHLRNGAQATVITAAGALIGGDAANGLDVDVTRLPALVAGTANIGDVDILSIAAGDNNIGNVDIVSGTITTVTTVTTVSALGVGTTGPQKAEDVAAAGGDMGVAIMAVRLDTPVANAGVSLDGDYTTPVVDNFRKLWVSGTVPEDTAHVAGEALTVVGVRRIDTAATSAGASADWATMDASAEGAVWATLTPTTTSGLTTMNATSSDGATALTSTAQVIKATTGNLYGYYIYNPNATAQFVQFYNTAAASVTVGTTNPLFMLTIPATSAANLMFAYPVNFSNAGFSWAATSTAGGNGAPGTALDAVCWYK